MSDRTCAVEWCEFPPVGRGWCSRHWQRWRRLGDPEAGGKWRNMDAADERGPYAGCWEWTGTRNRQGYGIYSRRRVHRIAYEAIHGPITGPEMCVLHRCDNPPCWRPDHLLLGTRADNAADRRVKGRDALGERRPQTKLTEEQVVAIKAAILNGARTSDLGRAYGVSAGAIEGIRRGDSWRWVEVA